MKKYALGVDVGGTTVKVGLFTVDGEVLDKWEVKTSTDDAGEHILPDVAASINKVLSDKGITTDDVEGVGIGVPGPVLANGTVNRCVNLGWGVKDVAGEFSALLNGLTVKVGNDANVAALGEMWKGGGQGYNSGIMITLGTGVGGGSILDGKILTGVRGAAGELGHVKMVDGEEESCGCGKKGHLEQYASANGIAHHAEKVLAFTDRETSLRGIEPLTCKDVFDKAKEGDEVACEIVEWFGRILGRAMATFACVVDPEVIVIGRGVSQAGQIVIDAVRPHFVEDTFHACEGTEIVLATLGNDAGIFGAVRQVL